MSTSDILARIGFDLKMLQELVEYSSKFIINYGFQIVGALIILVVGWLVSGWLARLTFRLCRRAHIDITLSEFFASLVKTIVLVFVFIIALGKFGVTITPLIAALSAVAFGSTLALQGPLSNYGAGLGIILTRPFVVGDTIRVQGVSGIVEHIQLSQTSLVTEDGEIVRIPNNKIAGEIIHNSSANLMVEASLGIGYDSDPERAAAIILQVLAGTPDVVRDPAPHAGIEKFEDSAIRIGYRYSVPTRRYYPTLYSVNGRVLAEFRRQGITIPYPRRDVRLIATS
jgi:small conductance mechanosensitive channel